MAAAVLGAWLMSPTFAAAQPEGRSAAALRQSLSDLDHLRAKLDRVNEDVAELKRSPPSVTSDYRLRDRMADAEALAKKVTEAEAKLRALGWRPEDATARAPVAPPTVSSDDGSVELEAKAGLIADEARRLDGEADRLAKAADELRSRRILRRRAGAWERDPFAGLEASKRNLAAVAPTSRSSASSSATGSNGAIGSPGSTTTTKGGTSSSDSSGTFGPPAGGPTITISSPSTSSEAAAAAKTSPQTGAAAADHQPIDQRLYLDPATAAELRQALGSNGATSDPEALDRAAAALRTRARALQAQAQTLIRKSRAP